ncbi:MAG: hypothetical protein C5S47_03000 [Candidatus Methanogasteraceae archaeon]|nr:MAG: hypothetical protein C5S47_03000 [ANME-2 cluster archaeon]
MAQGTKVSGYISLGFSIVPRECLMGAQTGDLLRYALYSHQTQDLSRGHHERWSRTWDGDERGGCGADASNARNLLILMDSVVFKRCQKRLIHPLRLRVLASWRFSDLTQRRRDAERCPRPHTCEGSDSDHRKRQNQKFSLFRSRGIRTYC